MTSADKRNAVRSSVVNWMVLALLLGGCDGGSVLTPTSPTPAPTPTSTPTPTPAPTPSPTASAYYTPFKAIVEDRRYAPLCMTPDGDLFNPLDVGNGFAEFLINNPKRSYEVNPSEETYSSVFNQSNSESFTHGFDEYFRIYYEGDLTHSSTILKIRDIISTRPFIYLRYFEYYHTSLIHKDVTLSCLPGVETLLSDIPQKLSINSNDFFFVDQYIYGNEDYSLKSSEFGITLNAVAGLATVNALIVGQANAESDSEKYVGQGRLDGGTGLWTGSLTKLSDGSNGGRFSVAFFGPRAEEAALAIYLKSVPAHEGLSATLLAVGQRP